MRTTTSRFSSFVASVDPSLEGRPTALNASRTSPGHLSALEQHHPEAVRTLTLLWGYPELNQYFDRVAAGNDARFNFDAASMAELMLLSAMHQRICPHRPATALDDAYATARWSGPWRPARYRG